MGPTVASGWLAIVLLVGCAATSAEPSVQAEGALSPGDECTIDCRGTVETYDVREGYGYLRSPTNSRIYVEVGAVTTAGLEASMAPGFVVTYDLDAHAAGGPRAVHLHDPQHGLIVTPPGRSCRVDCFGVVVTYSAVQGYGWIQPNDGSDRIYVQVAAVDASGLTLTEGMRLIYDVDSASNDPSATHLRLDE